MQETETTLGEPDYAIPGLRIHLCDPPEPWALIVRSATKLEWGVYADDIISQILIPDRPRTTIVYQGLPYRIHDAEETPAGWIYRMKPWPENETNWLHVVELSPDAYYQKAIERRAFERMMTRTASSFWWDFLLGWLPARIQEELADRWQFGAADASRRNGLIECWLGMGIAAAYIPSLFIGGGFGTLFLLFLCALEGLIRYGHSKGSERPLGLLLLELADRIYLALRPKRRNP